MNRYVDVPEAAPSPKTARYSHAVQAGTMLFITGQLPVDPEAPEAPPPAGIEAQTELVFRNLQLIAHGAGYSLSDAAFARIFLTDFDRDYADMNGVFHRYFADPSRMPGRTTIGVSRLGRGALVEIDLILSR